MGWATGSAAYGKHIRDVGGILLVMPQAALGEYVLGPIVCFSGAILLATAIVAGIKMLEDLAGLKEAKPAVEEEFFKESFREFDKDGNGVIDRKELRAMIHHFYQLGGHTNEPTDKQIAHLMKMADIDGDGKINYEEFVLFMKKLAAAADKGQVWCLSLNGAIAREGLKHL